MLKIILTGSIATGKSTVSDIMKRYGAVIVDTDIIAHQIYNHPSPTSLKILNEFGNEYLENNQINRVKLSKLVFSDKKYLEKLNSIVHPDVRQEVQILSEKYALLEKEKNINLLLVYVIPLYFETGKNYEADYVVVSACSKENQIDRLMKRNNFTYEQAIARINAQISISDKINQADYVIDTNGDFAQIEYDVKSLILSWSWSKYEEN